MTVLAERCGLSQPYLSQLENGKGAPSIGTLYRIANALDVSPQDLLPLAPESAGLVIRSGSVTPTPIDDRANSATARVLVGSPEKLLQIQEVVADAGQDLGGFFEHEGEEFLYVVEGNVEVTLQGQPPARLGPGDAMWYPATTAHQWAVTDAGRATLLVVNATVPGRQPHH
jgi:transcriptional regulator with XRE-family HTH domain